MSFKDMNPNQISSFIKFFRENYKAGWFNFKKGCYQINGNQCESTEEVFEEINKGVRE